MTVTRFHRWVFSLLAFFIAVAPVGAAGGSSGIDESFFAEGGPLDRPAGTVSEAPAAGIPEMAGGAEIDLAATGFKVIGALFFVSALIVGVYKFGRKAKLPFFAGGEHVKRIATEAVGPNQFISIVEIAGKILVLGVGEKGLTKLAELDGEAADRIRLVDAADRKASGEARVPFREVLTSLTGWGRNEAMPAAGSGRFDEICASALRQERRRMEGLRI